MNTTVGVRLVATFKKRIMKINDIAKQLANKVNQEHYILHYLKKVEKGAYEKGVKDTESKQLILHGVVDSKAELCQCKGMRSYMAKPKGRFCLKCDKYIWHN